MRLKIRPVMQAHPLRRMRHAPESKRVFMCRILLPVPKRKQIEAYGAELIPISGPRSRSN